MRKISEFQGFPRKSEQAIPKLVVEVAGQQWIVADKPKEGPSGPYDEVLSFGRPSHLVGTIPPAKRFSAEKWSHGEFLGVSRSTIREAMRRVSEIANDSDKSPDNDGDRLEYQTTIMPVFLVGTQKLLEELEQRGAIKDNNFAIFSPLQGGEFTAAALVDNARQLGWEIPFEKLAHYELKRVLMPDGRLLLGVRKYYLPVVNEETTVVVADDCVATDISARGTLTIAGEVSKKQPLVMVAAASQHAMSELASRMNVKTITGEVVFSMNEDFYLMRTKEEGFAPDSFFVGDMGRWLAGLPEEFDEQAPWNRGRREIVNYWAGLTRGVLGV